MEASTRAGRFVDQSGGFRAFVPAPLPPDPAVAIDGAMLGLLSDANLALGRLDGVASMVPDPDLLVAMFVRREAVFSSQIEGTQSTLEDLLEVELDPARTARLGDVGEIVNYVRALRYGLERLETLPLSLRLIREIHAELLRDGRGAHAGVGEFRRSQNWIGPASAPLTSASFVPPPVTDMHAALADLEAFLHREGERQVLLDIGIAHAQFETIHPFLDGNGRVGRLLIAFLLVHHGVLRAPLLYLSHFFKLHRAEYYDRLQAVRIAGDWEGWLRFFLRGVASTAAESTATAERIFELREQHRALALEHLGAKGVAVLTELFRQPVVNVNHVARVLDVTFATANRLVTELERLGVLLEVTGQRRGRLYRYEPYLALFEDSAPTGPPDLGDATSEGAS
jgi:Fic family protein